MRALIEHPPDGQRDNGADDLAGPLELPTGDATDYSPEATEYACADVSPFIVPEGEGLLEGDYGDDWLIGSDA
jgi:hypothetical protein